MKFAGTYEASKLKTMKSTLIAPCGMNCRMCYAYIRDKMACPGCYGNSDLKAKSTASCRIKNCRVLETGKFKYCFECEYYPCSRIQHLNKRYITKYGMSMIANLETIKQFGIRNFIKREKERWKCSNCGEILCVHSEKCIFCGHKWR